MLIKIYFQHKPLFISSSLTGEIKTYQEDSRCIVINGHDERAVQDIADRMQQDDVTAGVILTEDTQAVLGLIKNKLTFIQAAGGLVCTDTDEILIIYRRGKWDLPKGKLDEGEEIEDCAVREVEEETGLDGVVLKEPLIITHHTYHQKNDFILKESHWFLMRSERKALTPQTDEDIEKCEWVKWENLDAYLKNTHPSIADVIQAGRQKRHKKRD